VPTGVDVHPDEVDVWELHGLGDHRDHLCVGDPVLDRLGHVADRAVREEVRRHVEVVTEPRLDPQQDLCGRALLGCFLLAVVELDRAVEDDVAADLDRPGNHVPALDRAVHGQIVRVDTAPQGELQFAAPERVAPCALTGEDPADRGVRIGLDRRHDPERSFRPMFRERLLVVAEVLDEVVLRHDEQRRPELFRQFGDVAVLDEQAAVTDGQRTAQCLGHVDAPSD